MVEAAIIIAGAFVLALLVQQFVVKPYTIPSPSMEPTLQTGDRVLVNRLSYHFRSPAVGDVVVFRPPGLETAEPFIKRVVAVAGDRVSVHEGSLYVNGIAQVEPYVKEYPIAGELREVTVGPGCVWVMGDNRNDSSDSRVFGEVPRASIVGVAFAIYWPPRHMGGL
jgi:signal peptidase I